MSKIALEPNASGTGTFSIVSPNSNSNRTLTLPDATTTLMGTDTAVTQTQLATALNASGSAPIYACRAWVNFNGTGTVAIRASGNVSSITDNGTGDYTVNFTTAMPDANYAAITDAGNVSGTIARPALVYSKSTTSCSLQARGLATGNALDVDVCDVTIFR